MPANHTTAIPLIAIKSDVPKSGWTITSPIGNRIIISDVIIVYIEFTCSIFIRWKYFAKHRMIQIFINSEGCKLIKYKSIHLWDPEDLIPNKYVQTKRIITIR